jgi:hypothetical protein
MRIMYITHHVWVAYEDRKRPAALDKAAYERMASALRAGRAQLEALEAIMPECMRPTSRPLPLEQQNEEVLAVLDVASWLAGLGGQLGIEELKLKLKGGAAPAPWSPRIQAYVHKEREWLRAWGKHIPTARFTYYAELVEHILPSRPLPWRRQPAALRLLFT